MVTTLHIIGKSQVTRLELLSQKLAFYFDKKLPLLHMHRWNDTLITHYTATSQVVSIKDPNTAIPIMAIYSSVYSVSFCAIKKSLAALQQSDKIIITANYGLM